MTLSDVQRAEIMARQAPLLVQQLDAVVATAGGEEGDLLSIGVGALVAAAVALAASRCVSAATAVALIRCTAESAAADIYGDAA